MSTHHVLFGDALRSSAQPWLDELGKSDRDRLLALFDLAIDEKTRLSDCLTRLYPGTETTRALADLTRLRMRLNDASDGDKHTKPDLGFRFHVDTKKKNPPTERFVWFTGPRHLLDGPTLRGVARLPADPVEPLYAPAEVHIFVSFANKDRTEMDELVDLLKTTWGQRRNHRVSYWRFHRPNDDGILVGEDNEQRIREAMASSPLGLLLLSPDYTASKFIERVELPGYFPAPKGKHPIFVNLRNSPPWAKHLPPGIDRQFIFAHHDKSYSEMQTKAEKEQFAMALNEHIEALCNKLIRIPDAIPATVKALPSGEDCPVELATLMERRRSELECTPVPPKFDHRGSFVPAEDAQPISEGGIHAVDDLVTWAQSRTRSCYFALLGEVGAGKTTATLMFAERLNAMNGPERAYYFDMRFVNQDGLLERTQKTPKLDEILSAIVGRQTEGTQSTSARDYLHAVKHQRAVLIFDGLDEVLTGLDATQQDAFMHQLMLSLPPEATASDKAGKLLLACRTHYFRTSIAERGTFTIQGREGIEESESAGKRSRDGKPNRAAFEVARMLPFTEEQIRAYFEANLPAMPFDQIWDLLTQIHNLRELATRPYLLNLIRQQIPRLNASLERGQPVSAIDLYAGFLQDWTEVRNREHDLIRHEDKLTLMAELAAWMWRNDTKTVAAADLESWALRTIAKDPLWVMQYGDYLKPAQVSSFLAELRNSTVVARWQGNTFRFAHTSLQEYFLACYLMAALREKRDAAWDMPVVSKETLDFLGQIIAQEPRRAECLASLERIIGGECLRAACLAFQYWLEAIKHGHPEPQPKQVNLAGAEANDWEIKGHSAQRPLNLRGANLRGIKLNRTRVQFVDATGADLTGMEARQALFIGVQAPKARVVDSDVAGLQWRKGSLLGADVTGTPLGLAQLMQVERENQMDPGAPESDALAKRWISPRTGHTSFVSACAWSPDGQRLLSCSGDNTLKVWDAATCETLLTLTGHTSSVFACAWSSDGKRLLSGSWDNTLKVWDAATGKTLLTLTGHTGYVNACAWSPDGKRLLSGSDDHTLKVWDAATGEALRTLTGHTSSVNACAWSPDGQRLLSGSWDETLKVWDAATGEALLRLPGHTSAVLACAWSPDGQRLLSGSLDETLKMWDAATGKVLLTLTGHTSSVRACAWSPDGQRLFSGLEDHTLKVWDAATGEALLTLTGHTISVRACAWSPDGKRLLSGSDDHTLKVWDAATGETLLTLTGLTSSVFACAWSPDGKRLLSGSSDHTLKVWDAATGEALLTLTGLTSSVNACAWSPDGQRLLSGSDDHTLKVWDAATGETLLTLTGLTSSVFACTWSPDGQRLLSGSEDNTLKVWDAATGEALLTLTGLTSYVNACAWSPDGKRLLSGSLDKTLKVWDAATGEALLTLTGHTSYVNACAWSPDCQRLLSGSWDKTLKVWDAATGEALLTLTGHTSSVYACAWSPDGKRLLSGSDDNTLKVWDAATGEALLTLTGHTSSVHACAWSPDGLRLLSGSRDNTLKVWDAESGACLTTLHCLPEHQAAAISGDRQRVLSCSPEAWRWLGWQTFDAEGRFLPCLPIEAFGPIPGLD